MIATAHFQARRTRFFEHMMDNSIALLSAGPMQYRNSDTEYPYRQESHFHYLTGFDESFAIAAMIKSQGKTRFILFCQERDDAAERWTGERVGIKGAVDKYAADEAYPINEASLRFPQLFLGTGYQLAIATVWRWQFQLKICRLRQMLKEHFQAPNHKGFRRKFQ